MNGSAKLSQHHASVPDRIAHIGFTTKRFEAMLDWYTRVFLATAIYQDNNLVFLSYDEEEHHRVVILRLPDEAPDKNPNGPGMLHLAHTFNSIEGLLGTYERLKNEGIEPVLRINHGVTTSLYYMDPDGNQVEFQCDNFESIEECRAYFQSAAFQENPVGLVYDPEILLAGIAAGRSFDSVMAEAIEAADQSELPAKP